MTNSRIEAEEARAIAKLRWEAIHITHRAKALAEVTAVMGWKLWRKDREKEFQEMSLTQLLKWRRKAYPNSERVTSGNYQQRRAVKKSRKSL